MSDRLTLAFAPDMPAAAVEVLAPDLESTGRVWLMPGESKVLSVPSRDSYLRVHLPSGDVVSLRTTGGTHQSISLNDLRHHREGVTGSIDRHRRRDRSHASGSSYATWSGGSESSNAKLLMRSRDAYWPDAPLDRHFINSEAVVLRNPTAWSTATISLALAPSNRHAKELITPLHIDQGAGEVTFMPTLHSGSYDLIIGTPSKITHVRLPGWQPGQKLGVRVWADHQDFAREVVNVRVSTGNAQADSLGAFMARGDMRSAESMTDWVEAAGSMLQSKMSDPNAATLGAYLLLRLRRFEVMHSWARNLANWWPYLADGSIIWAWQLIHQRGIEEEIRHYLLRAAAAIDLPVFTEGVQLLGDGLRLVGAEDELARLYSRVGVLEQSAPFTTSTRIIKQDDPRDIQIDVRYDIDFTSQDSTPP